MKNITNETVSVKTTRIVAPIVIRTPDGNYQRANEWTGELEYLSTAKHGDIMYAACPLRLGRTMYCRVADGNTSIIFRQDYGTISGSHFIALKDYLK